MLALMVAISAVAPTQADIGAASNMIRANTRLAAPLVRHAGPVMLCSIEAMAAIRPDEPSGAGSKDGHGKDFATRLRAEWSKCGFEKEARFWAKSVKLRYPEFSDELAQDASEECLTYFIFDTLSDASQR